MVFLALNLQPIFGQSLPKKTVIVPLLVGGVDGTGEYNTVNAVISPSFPEGVQFMGVNQEGTGGLVVGCPGFGGCLVAFTKDDQIQEFSQQVLEKYQLSTGIEAKVFPAIASDGAGIIDFNLGSVQ